jgi:hypothetical protein
LECSALEREAAPLREQQTAIMVQMPVKINMEKQTNEKNETKVKAAPNRAAICNRTSNMLPSNSTSGKGNPPMKIFNVNDMELTYWES